MARRFYRAGWNLTRRVVPPMTMAATLLTLGFLAWPAAEGGRERSSVSTGTDSATAEAANLGDSDELAQASKAVQVVSGARETPATYRTSTSKDSNNGGTDLLRAVVSR